MSGAVDEQQFLLPNPPLTFLGTDLDRLLVHLESVDFSDVHIQSGTAVISEIHGRMRKVIPRPLNTTEVESIIVQIYGENAPAQIARGKAIDCSYEAKPERGVRYRYRVNAVGVQVNGAQGIQITIRAIPTTPPELSMMKLEPEVWEAFSTPKQGLILVTGATGSGKSTLMASCLRAIAEDPDAHKKIVTYESPIEFVYDGIQKPTSIVCQSEVPRHCENFHVGIEAALRRKPHIILIGEARDPETIISAVLAAQTGHVVYSTVHTNGVPDTTRRMLAVFPADERNSRQVDIVDACRLIITQRLVPTVDGKRTALREYLVFDDDVRTMLTACDPDDIAAVTRRLVEERGQPMVVDAERKFKDGLIDKKEFDSLAKSYAAAKRDEST